MIPNNRLQELNSVLITFLTHSPEDKGEELLSILESIIAAFITAEEYRKAHELAVKATRVPMFDK